MAIRGNAAFHVRPYLSVQPGQFYRIARRGFWGDGICKGKATLQQVVDLLHIAGRRYCCTPEGRSSNTSSSPMPSS